MKYFALLAVFMLGCTNQAANIEKSVSELTPETKNAIAICSSQFSDEQKVFLEGQYLEEKARISAGTNSTSKGLVVDQSNMTGQEKLELIKMYHTCVNSHLQKKKS
ncbi:hypothetical protein BIT28_25320 [Photobacterium proteolyticum]|uniref:Lipoprotein n=1 Tax=Photobacterium proteolyticum TaxID=1903952 RepID=A0A1Q9GFE1_9GAMM|nr:hypothetical protein [Photobacterium proteolyticum]OLQ73149.1 hypothetical protein BIT28_25320 [Photobacterium proteolyticum]